MNKLVRLVPFAISLFLSSFLPDAMFGRAFTAKELPLLIQRGGYVIGSAVNDSGQVVGRANYQQLPLEIWRAFLWSPATGIQDLGTLYFDSGATGVNNLGEVVGFSGDPGGASRAFLWSPSMGMVSLGTLGGDYSHAHGINDAQLVVGSTSTSGGTDSVPFLWTQSSGMQPLDGVVGGAMAVNNSGQVVGFCCGYQDSTHAFVWSQESGFQDLGVLPGFDGSFASAISDNGQVVGTLLSYTKDWHAFRWTAAAGMQDIGDLGPGSYPPSVEGVNNSGLVTGTSALPSEHAFVWTAAAGFQDLNILTKGFGSRKFLLDARAINNWGQIVAIGQVSTGIRTWLLTPIVSISLTSSPNPSRVGEEVTFAATANSINGPAPDGDQVIFLDGNTVLGQSSIAGGVAKFSTSTLNVRQHPIYAVFAGDPVYALRRKSGKVVQVVTK